MADKIYGLKTGGLVKVVDVGESQTVVFLGTEGVPLTLPKDEGQVGAYRSDARRMIDELSRDLNPIGLDRFAAAFLYELLVEGYRGTHNT
jgi:hypothetical protein